MNSSKVNDGLIYEAEQFVTPLAVRKCHLPVVQANSIVMAITGEGKTRGMTALLKTSATINQHLAYIRLLQRQTAITPEYLHLYLQGIYSFIRMESAGTDSTKGAITCNQIRKFPVPIPSESEQNSILKMVGLALKDSESTTESIKNEIIALTEFKEILISNVATGKIKV